MTQSTQIHEKLSKLLKSEEPAIRALITEAIQMAQNKRLSADQISTKLQREIDVILRGQ